MMSLDEKIEQLTKELYVKHATAMSFEVAQEVKAKTVYDACKSWAVEFYKNHLDKKCLGGCHGKTNSSNDSVKD